MRTLTSLAATALIAAALAGGVAVTVGHASSASVSTTGHSGTSMVVRADDAPADTPWGPDGTNG